MNVFTTSYNFVSSGKHVSSQLVSERAVELGMWCRNIKKIKFNYSCLRSNKRLILTYILLKNYVGKV